VSFNGGPGGIAARPTAGELAAAHERHVAATAAQMQNEKLASTNRSQLASMNNGRPGIAAAARAGEFSGKGVIAATAPGAGYRREAAASEARPAVSNGATHTANTGSAPPVHTATSTPATVHSATNTPAAVAHFGQGVTPQTKAAPSANVYTGPQTVNGRSSKSATKTPAVTGKPAPVDHARRPSPTQHSNGVASGGGSNQAGQGHSTTAVHTPGRPTPQSKATPVSALRPRGRSRPPVQQRQVSRIGPARQPQLPPQHTQLSRAGPEARPGGHPEGRPH
jgi:hypothetical protein